MSHIGPDIVLKTIQQVFPQEDEDEILARLEPYGSESHEKEKYRVYLAILKLCDEEQLSDPSHYVQAAKQDYRDVLAWAEYPHQMTCGPVSDPDTSARLRKQDRAQFQAWLNKCSGAD